MHIRSSRRTFLGTAATTGHEPQKRATMLFQNQSKVVNDPQGTRRKALQDVLG